MEDFLFGRIENYAIDAIGDVLGITLEQMRSEKKYVNLVYARLIFTHIMSENGITLTRIGNILNKNHSTITYQNHKYKEEYEYNSDFRDIADKTTNRFKNLVAINKEKSKNGFVSAKAARMLNEHGFSFPCIAYACGDDDIDFINVNSKCANILDLYHSSKQKGDTVLVPTLQSAIEWLVNEHEINVTAFPVWKDTQCENVMEWYCVVSNISYDDRYFVNCGTFFDKNEALNYGIEYVLEHKI